MARKSQRRDWQERAFEETELKRRDRQAGTATDGPDVMKPSTDFKRRSSWKATGVAVLIVLVALIIRVQLNNRAPSLTTSCTTPAFALSSTSPSTNSTLRWSATGPRGMHFVIEIGIERLEYQSQAGHLHAVPQPGHAPTMTEQAVLATAMPSNCKTNGSFPVQVPKGSYLIKMFRLDGTGTSVTGTEVATKTLTVS